MKLEEFIISCSRAILLIASIFCLIGWVVITMMALSYYGPARNAERFFLTLFPLIYFSLTIYGCLFIKTKRKLIILGISLNLPMAVFIVYLFISRGEFAPAMQIGVAFIAVWALLCLGHAWFKPSAT